MSYLLEAWQEATKLCLTAHCIEELQTALDAELPIALHLPHAPDDGAKVLGIACQPCLAHH